MHSHRCHSLVSTYVLELVNIVVEVTPARVIVRPVRAAAAADDVTRRLAHCNLSPASRTAACANEHITTSRHVTSCSIIIQSHQTHHTMHSTSQPRRRVATTPDLSCHQPV